MQHFYYHRPIVDFLRHDPILILGELTKFYEFPLEDRQKNAWITQIHLLKDWLDGIDGTIIFEYSIPRMGKRIDCVILSGHVIFAVEFKVGADTYDRQAIDQVVDYALDLKNFHKQSHDKPIVPILICTKADENSQPLSIDADGLFQPVCTNGSSLPKLISAAKYRAQGVEIDPNVWINSVYLPTPTIIEAAQALYRGHRVEDISRNDAGAINLGVTARAISTIIEYSKQDKRKSICFLTGVPGSGKTLAGLNLANSWHDAENVLLS